MAQVHGFVKEKDSNTSLEYANIAFVAPDDSTIIAYAVADSTGYFKLNTSKTEGKVKISFLGYKSQEVVVNNNTDLDTILLQKDENMLGEVTVKANHIVRTTKGLTVNNNVSSMKKKETDSRYLTSVTSLWSVGLRQISTNSMDASPMLVLYRKLMRN
jgi:hypothetical protein